MKQKDYEFSVQVKQVQLPMTTLKDRLPIIETYEIIENENDIKIQTTIDTNIGSSEMVQLLSPSPFQSIDIIRSNQVIGEQNSISFELVTLRKESLQ